MNFTLKNTFTKAVDSTDGRDRSDENRDKRAKIAPQVPSNAFENTRSKSGSNLSQMKKMPNVLPTQKGRRRDSKQSGKTLAAMSKILE